MKWQFYLPVLFTVSLAGRTMLATIDAPVETEFGTYVPLPVTIEPHALQVDLEEDLSNVLNLSNFNLTEDQISKLKANHFVVTPATQSNKQIHFNEMFDLYCEARELGIPVFVTTDAMLHSFHLCFDHILKTCEEERFFSQLNELLDALWGKTWEQYNTATEAAVRKALFRNLDYLLVSSQLLVEKKFVADPLPGGHYFEEITLIQEAAGFNTSPIFSSGDFNYQEDYSQYKPRGHYTKSDSLEDYFRSMMWLGRMTFGCTNSDTYSQTMTLSAILLTQAISSLEINGRPAADIWDDIYQPTVFFVGKSDDINFTQYLNIAYDVYGKSFPIDEPDMFGDQDKLMDFLQATENLDAAAITYPGQPDKGFRFMGQRFIPDSWILDELVYNKIPDRYMPTGLDIMTVLGPEKEAGQEWAYQYVPEDDKANPYYVAKLDTLKKAFQEYPAETWAQNAYWNWLYCLMPLLTEFGEGYPYFMQTDAWRDKDLFAALASWAELRHDTILYAKQSGTETTGMQYPLSAALVQGYVEPNPYAFARLAALADFMIEGLRSKNLLFEEFRMTLESFSDLAAGFKTIAEKELTSEPLTQYEYQMIFNVGNRLYKIVTFNFEASGPTPWDVDNDPMPVIADVHTDLSTYPGVILEEGVGYPYAVYVLCNIAGRIVLTKGAGYSYYELTRPVPEGRLNDEEWRDMLDNGSAPDMPEWSCHFICGQDDESKAGTFYQWESQATAYIDITLNKTTLTTTDTLKIDLISNAWNPVPPDLLIIFSDGHVQSVPLIEVANGYWRASKTLDQWEEDNYILKATQQNGNQLLEFYRLFTIVSGSAVHQDIQPAGWRLEPAFPNPFNPSTTIRYSVPEQAHVRLNVLNIRGELVKKIRSGSQSPGEYSANWDGLNNHNFPVRGGVYLIRLESENTAFTRKITLIR
ncbi:DUF3160 domain-containing protein [bacterium]|nr:DUF3160 domain-containing protein [bacterium]